MSEKYDQTTGSIAYQLDKVSPGQKVISLKMSLAYARGLLEEMVGKQDEINRLRMELAKNMLASLENDDNQ